MKKLLVAVAIAALAVAGGAVAWKLVDDDERRQGNLNLQTPTTLGGPQTVAGGQGPYAIYTASTNVPAGGVDDVTRSCPLGTKVLGGGHASTRVHELRTSALNGNGHQVRVLAQGDAELTSYAICATASLVPGYEIRTEQFTIGTGSALDNEEIACPAGKKAIAGGFSAADAPGPQTKLVTSGPSSDTEWLVEVTRRTVASEGIIHVVCASVPDFSRHSEAVTFANNVGGTVSAGCPAGKKALGGGFGFRQGDGTPSGTVALAFAGKFNTYPSSSTWRVAVGALDHGHGRAYAYVLCGTIE